MKDDEKQRVEALMARLFALSENDFGKLEQFLVTQLPEGSPSSPSEPKAPAPLPEPSDGLDYWSSEGNSLFADVGDIGENEDLSRPPQRAADAFFAAQNENPDFGPRAPSALLAEALVSKDDLHPAPLLPTEHSAHALIPTTEFPIMSLDADIDEPPPPMALPPIEAQSAEFPYRQDDDYDDDYGILPVEAEGVHPPPYKKDKILIASTSYDDLVMPMLVDEDKARPTAQFLERHEELSRVLTSSPSYQPFQMFEPISLMTEDSSDLVPELEGLHSERLPRLDMREIADARKNPEAPFLREMFQHMAPLPKHYEEHKPRPRVVENLSLLAGNGEKRADGDMDHVQAKAHTGSDGAIQLGHGSGASLSPSANPLSFDFEQAAEEGVLTYSLAQTPPPVSKDPALSESDSMDLPVTAPETMSPHEKFDVSESAQKISLFSSTSHTQGGFPPQSSGQPETPLFEPMPLGDAGHPSQEGFYPNPDVHPMANEPSNPFVPMNAPPPNLGYGHQNPMQGGNYPHHLEHTGSYQPYHPGPPQGYGMPMSPSQQDLHAPSGPSSSFLQPPGGYYGTPYTTGSFSVMPGQGPGMGMGGMMGPSDNPYVTGSFPVIHTGMYQMRDGYLQPVYSSLPPSTSMASPWTQQGPVAPMQPPKPQVRASLVVAMTALFTCLLMVLIWMGWYYDPLRHTRQASLPQTRSTNTASKSAFTVKQSTLVSLESSPNGAQIFLDEVATGKKTPAGLRLAKGTYTIELRRKGFKSRSQKITIAQERRLSFFFDLQPEVEQKLPQATVVISSTPTGSWIWLDRERTSLRTPAALHTVPGKHTILVASGGFHASVRQLTLSDGDVKHIHFSLRRKRPTKRKKPAKASKKSKKKSSK